MINKIVLPSFSSEWCEWGATKMGCKNSRGLWSPSISEVNVWRWRNTVFLRLEDRVFVLPKHSKNLDPSCDGSRSLGLFRKRKTCIIAKFHGTDLVICSHSREAKTRLTAEWIWYCFILFHHFYKDDPFVTSCLHFWTVKSFQTTIISLRKTRGGTYIMITYVSKENNLGPGDKIRYIWGL